MPLADDLVIYPVGAEITTAFPPPGLYLDGAGDYASSPDDNSLDITANKLSLRAAVLQSVGAVNASFVSKWRATGNQRSYRLYQRAAGGLGFDYSPDGTTIRSGVGAAAITLVSPALIRADWNPGGGATPLAMYSRAFNFNSYLADLDDDTISVAAWRAEAITTQPAAGNVFSSTAPLEIGASDAGYYATGAVYAALVKDMTAVVDAASPDFGAQADYVAAFADATGKTFTMNGDAYMIPRTLDGFFLEDGSPYDPAVYLDLDQALAHGKIYGIDATTGWPKLPDMMNSQNFPRGGWKVGTIGGSLSTGTPSLLTASLAGGSGPTPGAQNHTHAFLPPFMNKAYWIKW